MSIDYLQGQSFLDTRAPLVVRGLKLLVVRQHIPSGQSQRLADSNCLFVRLVLACSLSKGRMMEIGAFGGGDGEHGV